MGSSRFSLAVCLILFLAVPVQVLKVKFIVIRQEVLGLSGRILAFPGNRAFLLTRRGSGGLLGRSSLTARRFSLLTAAC